MDCQRDPRWGRRVGPEQGVGGAVEVRPSAEPLGEEGHQCLLLGRCLARPRYGRAERLPVVARASQLSEEMKERVGETRRLAHRLEVAVVRCRQLAEEDAVGERGEGTSARGCEPPFPEREPEFTQGHEVDAGYPAGQGRDAPLKVGAEQGSADEHADRGERVALFRIDDVPSQRALERGGEPVTT